MGRNDRTSPTGMGKALENVFVGTSDSSRDIAPAPFLQAQQLGRRFKMSPAVAAVIAAHAYGVAESWGGCRP